MPLAGETSPVTLLGTVVITNAENLGNLVILQFASPGAPVIYGAASTNRKSQDRCMHDRRT
jgi:trimethylamine--corrinoid protein Co-methyltransferase